MKIEFETKINELLNYFHSNNIEAYLVGGFIRDYLTNKTCYDLDFCLVSSYKEALDALKSKYRLEHIDEYGCIKFKIGEYDIEITHARKEREYLDYRHPYVIEFTSDLSIDCLRRDFTINALYYKDGEFYDFCGAMEDIKSKTLRVIGDTLTRFKEDPLRILRMIRFSCYDFDISINDKQIIKDNAYLLKELSEASFNKEFDKILMLNNLYIINEYKDLFENYFDIKIKNLINLNKLTFLEEKKTFLGIKNKSNLYKYRDLKLYKDKFEINKLIYKYGDTVIKELLSYDDKLNERGLMNIYNDIILNGYYSKKDLKINPNKIIELTNKKELTSYYIDMISYEIMKGNLINEEKEIIKFLERLI